MNRLEQDAADALQAYERQARHRQGYGPRPVEPIGKTWAPPRMTEQERKDLDQLINTGFLPF